MPTKIQQAYGIGSPSVPVFPPPILAERAPVNNVDTEYPPCQLWLDQSQSPAVTHIFVGSGTWKTITVS